MTDHTLPPSTRGIAFILVGMAAISINDLLIKQLSGGYPLHEIVLIRSVIGICLSLVLVHFEGGLSILKTTQPFMHLLRGLLVVVSNMAFFVALAAAPLADVTALFFAAPLFITLLSIPLLGEKVGMLRIGAVFAGFVGVLIMQRPWDSGETLETSRAVLLLPVLAALAYALMQLLTRKLGATTKASALAVYIQAMFIPVSLGFYLVAGDGAMAENLDSPALFFLLRAWSMPSAYDWLFLFGLGVNTTVIGYCLSQAYRLSSAATVAPFEYIGLPLAVFWGWLLWSDIPDWEVWVGMALIMGSGLFVYFREKQKQHQIARTRVKLPY